MLIVFNTIKACQEVYLIDRKNEYRRQHPALFFPFHEIPPTEKACRALDMSMVGDRYAVRKDTLLDGELVWDVHRDGTRTLRLLLFDCVVLDGTSMAQRPLSKRYGRLNELFLPPFRQFLRDNPHAANDAPYEVKVKPMKLAYGITSVLQMIPTLEHGNDGLIFTCIGSGYVSGTDPKIVKWKPPSENSIDFKLRLRFPPDYMRDPRGYLPDLDAKPMFQLEEYMGRDEYRYFDWLWLEDEEWEHWKASGEQLDDRIVECYWDPQGGPLDSMQIDPAPEYKEGAGRLPAWRLLRIRDDKHDGNHTTVVQKILRSIIDGVEEEELVQHEDNIRSSWKSAEREQSRRLQESAARQPAAIRPRRGAPAPMRGSPPEYLSRR
jgi:mRNA guanylyltransferase